MSSGNSWLTMEFHQSLLSWFRSSMKPHHAPLSFTTRNCQSHFRCTSRLLAATSDLQNDCWLDCERGRDSGIQCTLTTQPHDLDYGEDICLLSQKLQHMQTNTDHLALVAEKLASGWAKKRAKSRGLIANSGRRSSSKMWKYCQIRRQSRWRCKKQDRQSQAGL